MKSNKIKKRKSVLQQNLLSRNAASQHESNNDNVKKEMEIKY